jgi:hypothetical protein
LERERERERRLEGGTKCIVEVKKKRPFDVDEN